MGVLAASGVGAGAFGVCVACGVAAGVLVALGVLVAADAGAAVASVPLGVEVAPSPPQASTNAIPAATTANLKPLPQIVMAGMIP